MNPPPYASANHTFPATRLFALTSSAQKTGQRSNVFNPDIIYVYAYIYMFTTLSAFFLAEKGEKG